MSMSIEAAGTGRATGAPRTIRWFVVAISLAVGILLGALASQALGLGAKTVTPANPPTVIQVEPPDGVQLAPVGDLPGQAGAEVSGPGWSTECRAASGTTRC